MFDFFVLPLIYFIIYFLFVVIFVLSVLFYFLPLLDSSLFDLSWNPAPLRKMPASVPASPESGWKDKPHRKTTHHVHKANTIGIPSEADLNNSDTKLHSPSRTRLHFFEGFRNTLRSKHKSSDTVVLDAGKENEKDDVHRRWSEANHPTVNHFFSLQKKYIIK